MSRFDAVIATANVGEFGAVDIHGHEVPDYLHRVDVALALAQDVAKGAPASAAMVAAGLG